MGRKPKQPKDNLSSAEFEVSTYEKCLPAQRHEPGTPTTLIIDGMNFAHAAFHAYSRLTYKGKSVAIMFGMLQMVRPLIQQQKPTKVVICWDGDRSKRRLKWHPGYKGHRSSKGDEFHAQVERTRRLFHYLGITQLINPKVEGDDMVTLAVREEVKRNKVVVVSGDKDMLQLINHDVSVLNTRDRMGAKRSPYAFSTREPYCLLTQVVDFYCLVGDHSDDIPGIRGIGPSRALSFLNQYGSVENYLNDEDAHFVGMGDKDKVRKIWKLNRKLMDLNWYADKFLKKPSYLTYYRDKKFPAINEAKYNELCLKYNLKAIRTIQFIETFKNLGNGYSNSIL